ncbi:MAG: hypothetical protein IJT94_14095, partial [Oscillibacter sp.]|nr:hypothetical protein [Oscillibacter sp.]
MTSTFGIFTVARLGILAAGQGLNVTGNNIANINTDNYVRQNLDQFSLHVGGNDRLQGGNTANPGNGVISPAISHNRDIYLDIRYRNANAKVGEMESTVNGYDNLSTILDEVTKGEDGEGVLEGLYNEMVAQLNSLAAEGAGKDNYDTLFRSATGAFVHQLNKAASDLNALADTLTGSFERDLTMANKLIDQIRELNSSIRKNQIYGDRSLEQQDQRDGLLDQLSKYIRMEVSYEKEQVSRGLEVDKLVIYTGTEPRRLLVDGIYAANIVMRPNAGDDLGAVNDVGVPVPYDADQGAITDRYGSMTVGSAEQTFASEEDAQIVADKLTDSTKGKYVYRPVTDAQGVVTVHKYAPSDDALVFRSQEAAKEWAEAMNKEYAGIEYRAVGGTEGEPARVHKFKLNLDLNTTDLVDTHGLPKIVKEIDMGAVKNTDKGAITDRQGATEEGANYLTFATVGEAQELATQLTNDALGLFEYRVQTDEDGVITVHAWAATVYTNKVDALNALDEMQKDTSEHVNSNGEATKYYYEVREQEAGSGTFEIRTFDIFRGKVLLGDTELGGTLLADREILTEEGYFASELDLERDPHASGKRGIPYYQHALDSLANSFANALNEANQLPDEVIYKINDEGDFVDAEGNTVSGGPTQYVLRDEYKDYNGGVLLSNHPNTNDPTYITARNISISQNWDNGSFRVIRSTLPNAPSTANDNLNHIYN